MPTTPNIIAGSGEPDHDCALCPRLHAFIDTWRHREPDWFNGPVPTFLPTDGADRVGLLIIGLAPGVRGANRTGRPFTGDFAGDLLYSTLAKFGFSEGCYDARPDDGVELIGTAITNAVRCVPPENKPVPAEINMCRQFLAPAISRFPTLKAIVTLGAIAHQSTIKALGLRLAQYPFKHGARYEADGLALFPSYHCSRYNTNTGVLTPAMFETVFSNVKMELTAG
jgi:uracil-DNA glycosylase family 4